MRVGGVNVNIGPPDVDVVIAVHRTDRPVARAVASVLDHTRAAVRVTVVAHGISATPIEDALARHRSDRLRVVAFNDDVPSPAGPFNAGLDLATGTFTSVLGSDDSLQPGAIDSWLRLARRHDAAAVIARLRRTNGSAVPTPPTRPFRRLVDPVRDRLSYRSAPLGLVSREVFEDLRFAEGLRSGEDLSYVSHVWFSGERIVFDRTGPAYLMHDDATSRVTTTPRPVAEELAPVLLIVGSDWFTRQDARSRSAMVAKFLRINLFGAVTNRPDPAAWTRHERSELAAAAATLMDAGEGIQESLSRADRALLDVIIDPESSAGRMLDRARIRRRRLAMNSIIPGDLSHLFDREGPLRLAAASAIVSR